MASVVVSVERGTARDGRREYVGENDDRVAGQVKVQVYCRCVQLRLINNANSACFCFCVIGR